MILISSGTGAPAGVSVLVTSGCLAGVAVVAGQGEVILAQGAGAQGEGPGPGCQGGQAQTLGADIRGAFTVSLAQDKLVALQVVEHRQLLGIL